MKMAHLKALCRAKQTQLEMLRDRGYTIPPDEIPMLNEKAGLLTYTSIYGKADTQQLNREYHDETNDMYTYVYYDSTVVEYTDQQKPPPSKESIRMFFEAVDKSEKLRGYSENEHYNCVILITDVHPQVQTIRFIESISTYRKAPGCTVQTFVISDLLVNPTKHVLVPKHRLLSQIEQDKLYAEAKSTLVDPRPTYIKTMSHKANVMPLLKFMNISKKAETGDPVAKYYMAKPTDVFEIRRINMTNDNTMPIEIVYRYVIEA